jgi:hypothetical protein
LSFYFLGRRTVSEDRSAATLFVEYVCFGRQNIDADLALTNGLKG